MTTKTIFENISNRLLQAGRSVAKRVLLFAAGLPEMILMAVRSLMAPIFNIYVLFWCLKHLQKKLLDPLLDVSIGMSTLDGWKSERALRYTTDQLVTSPMNQIVKNNDGTRSAENSSSELSVNTKFALYLLTIRIKIFFDQITYYIEFNNFLLS